MPAELARIRHFVLDLDGTLYRGSRLFEATLPFLETLAGRGLGFTYLTNNTSKSTAEYLERLRALGLPAGESQIYTAADATREVLRRRFPAARRLALLGTVSLCREFEAAGYAIDWESPEVVVTAFDTGLTYERLCRTAWWVAQGLPFLATHPDRICPTDEATVLVDCGSISAAITAATGRAPHYCGKPEADVLRSVARRHGLALSELAMVGDRLYTDIAMAQRAQAMSILVLTGEATAREAAGHEPPPDLVVNDLSELVRRL